MSGIVGYVVVKTGTVTAKHENGLQEQLATHVAVYKNDVIITSDDSSVELILDNGNSIQLGANQRVVLDETVYEAKTFEDEQVVAEVESIQKLLEEVGDEAELDETAAGEETVDGGASLAADAYLAHDENLGFAHADYLPTEIERDVDERSVDADENTPPVAVNDYVSATEDTALILFKNELMANDFDPDDDAIEFASFTQPLHGTIVDNEDGTLLYTPDENYFGSDTFEYQISDGKGGVGTATVTILVEAVNDAPDAEDDYFTTPEDTTLLISAETLLSNDRDVEDDPLSIVSYTQPSHGSVTDNGDGTYSYIPNPDYYGPDSYTYTVTDGNGGFATATVHINVTPVNDAPVAIDDHVSTNEDTVLTITSDFMLSNDIDVDGDVLSIVAYTEPSHGTLVDNGDGTYSYTPDSEYNGPDSYTYTVTDGNGEYATATVYIDVLPVNDLPVAINDSVQTIEDMPVTITADFMLSNDYDIDGDTLSIASFTQPSHGTLVDNGNGTFTYTPDNNYFGSDSYTYTVTDGNGGFATATVNIGIDPINDNPIAVQDRYSTEEDTPIDIKIASIMSNDFDLDSDSIKFVTFWQPEHGQVVKTSSGTLTYIPDPDFNGVDSFVYKIRDDEGATDTTRVIITVDGANDAPIANDDTVLTLEDIPVVIKILDNDTDSDGTIDPSTVTILTPPAHGTLSVDPATGEVLYTPDPDFNGPDSFVYTVKDNDGNVSNPATVTINVAGSAEAPVAQDDAASTSIDTPVTINVISNDSDPDGTIDPTTITIISAPSNGTLVVNPDGTVDYVPNSGYAGPDSFVYTVNDNDGNASNPATVDIMVSNLPQIDIDDEDGAVTSADNSVVEATGDTVTGDITVSAEAGIATVTIDGADITNASVTPVVITGSEGTLTVTGYDAATGAITYAYTEDGMSEDHSGGAIVDSFTVEVTDLAGESNSDSLDIEIIDTTPVAVDDSVMTAEETTMSYNVMDNDTLNIDTQVTLTSATLANPAMGSVSFTPDGEVTFTPASGVSGDVVIDYTITDSDGDVSSATLTVSVVAVSVGNVALADDDDVDENIDLDPANDIVHTGSISVLGGSVVLAIDDTDPAYTSNGEAVTYQWDEATSTLTASTSAGRVFEVTVNGTNDGYTFTQYAAIDHPVLDAEDDLNITLQMIASDSSGTELLRTDFTVTVNDDVPVVTDPLVTVTTLNDGFAAESGTLPVEKSNDATDLTWNESGSTTPVMYAEGQVVEITYDDATDQVKGTIDGGATDVFALSVDMSATPPAYDFALLNQLVGTENTAATLLSGGNTSDVILDFGDAATGDVLISALATSTSTSASPTVNTSNQTIGVDDQFINSKYSDVLTIDFNDVAGTTGQVTAISFTLDQLGNGETCHWTAYGVDAAGNVVSFSGDIDGNTAGNENAVVELLNIDTSMYPAGDLLYMTKFEFSSPNNDGTTKDEAFRMKFQSVDFIDYNADVNMSFAYDVTDFDQDHASGAIDVNLTGLGYDTTSATVTVANDSAEVYEAAIDGVGTDAASDAEVVTGNLFANDTILFGTSLTSVSGVGPVGGVITVTTAEGNTLEVDADSSSAYFGQYTYTLNNPVTHPDGEGNNSVIETFSYLVTDAQGVGHSADLNVTIVDDVPLLNNQTQTISFDPISTNIIITLDTSGSMGDDPDGWGGYSSRMALAKAAISDLLDAYLELGGNDLSNVNVQLVTFANDDMNYSGYYYPQVLNVSGSTWLNINDAMSWLNQGDNTDPSGGTDYDMAWEAAHDQYNASTPPAADQTVSYFFSDGAPFDSDNVDEHQAALDYQDEWQTFVSSNQIDESFAIGIGSGVSPTYLNPAAWTYDEDTGTAVHNTANTIIVTNESELSDRLAETVVTKEIGNVLTGDQTSGILMGADGGTLLSVGYGTTIYTQADLNYDDDGDGTNDSVRIVTDHDAEMIINFDTGEYAYNVQRSDNGSVDFTDSFTATVMDADGDIPAGQAVLTINVEFPVTSSGAAQFKTALSDGDDNLLYDGSALDGGEGFDTMFLPESMNLDFSNIDNIKNIEQIDLSEGDHQLLNLSMEDVLDMTDDRNELTIMGDSRDSVSLLNTEGHEWMKADAPVQENGHTFDVYTNGDTMVKIEQDINDTIVS